MTQVSRDTSRGKATVKQLCKVFGISRQAYYNALKAPSEAAAVEPRPARSGPWATHAELLAAIELVVREHPGWGTRKVWAVVRRRGLIASYKRVWAVMHAQRLVLPPPEASPPQTRGHVVVADSNRRWASDLTVVWTASDGLVAVVPVIDCGDRSVLACEVTKSQESRAVLWPLQQALVDAFQHPRAVPDALELRTDHGSQYTGQDCADLCRHWSLDHTFAPVRRPTGNAVAERLIKTLKVELVWTRDWRSADELRSAVREWVDLYNRCRPHQALGWQTPAERRLANLSSCAQAAA